MVAMALIVFILTILAGAFAIASKTFSDLKGVGDMTEKLHTRRPGAEARPRRRPL